MGTDVPDWNVVWPWRNVTGGGKKGVRHQGDVPDQKEFTDVSGEWFYVLRSMPVEFRLKHRHSRDK
jgi:hypothetical protein